MIDENLKKAIRDNKLVLFIGAGASTPLNYPSWQNLVSGILDYLNSKFSETSDLNFTNLKRSVLDGSRSPLEILNKIEQDSKSGDHYKTKAKEYVYSVFNDLNTKNTLESDVHKLIWELSSKIVTTNYDQILEYNKPSDPKIDIFGNENEFMALKSQKDDSKFLYKIHGDFKNPKTIILFESDYRSIYSNSNSNEDALGSFFKNKTFLFLGFSLSDPFINELFSKIKAIYGNHTIGEHFIFGTNDKDFSEYDVTLIKLENWNDSLKRYLEDLISEKKIEGVIKIDEDVHKEIIEPEEENLNNLFLLVKNKTEELVKSPSNKVLASEIHDIESKINELIYGPLNFLKKFNTEYKNTHLQILFERIYGNEKLDQHTVNEINKIRTDHENHKWYERCQLVSALACSLFIFNKADEKKIAILVDFINDNEEKVWERAITYLIMILNHLGNKWLRFPFIKQKVNSLTLNSKVQSACQIIMEYILVFGIGNYNFSKEMFENSYFSNSPYNYFLPFFKENNPLFESIYDNYKGDDIERFIDSLDKLPFPDSLKYIICNTESKNESKNKNESNDEARKTLINHVKINDRYFPFAGYIQEFVSFIKNFPTLQHKKLIDTQLKITSTPLKDYLLSDIEKYRILGIHFHKEQNWGQAIVNFEKYLQLKQDDLTVLDNLANCYLNNKEFEKAKNTSKIIMSKFPDERSNLLRLANIYIQEGKFELALEMLEKYIDINSENAEVHFRKAAILIELEKYNEALVSVKKSDELSYHNKSDLYHLYGIIYKYLDEFDESLHFLSKSLSLDDQNASVFVDRADLYDNLGDYDNAIIDIEKAINIEPKETYLMAKAYYMLNINDFVGFLAQLSKIKSKDGAYYNLLANYYRLTGEYENAFANIEKAISMGDHKEYLGTKAAIYSSIGDDESFYKYLDEILHAGAKAYKFMNDIKKQYKNKELFVQILANYNQKL